MKYYLIYEEYLASSFSKSAPIKFAHSLRPGISSSSFFHRFFFLSVSRFLFFLFSLFFFTTNHFFFYFPWGFVPSLFKFLGIQSRGHHSHLRKKQVCEWCPSTSLQHKQSNIYKEYSRHSTNNDNTNIK